MKNTFKLNFEQQKKRAKELFKDFQLSNSEAVLRFEKEHPKLVHKEQSILNFRPKLADAQLVIARELGCNTWGQLKVHITLMESLREEVDQSISVIDEPMKCLHIRCGLDIKNTLSDAGFRGDFLEFSDPFCVGPVSYDYQVEQRAQFLYESYGKIAAQSRSEVLTKLKEAYHRFQNSSSMYENVVLWFEHDTYDQFILIFLLGQYYRFGLPKNLYIVTTNNFPGAIKFRGIGQLPAEGLRLLWQTKQPVTFQQCQEAETHWKAYTAVNKKVFSHHIENLKSSLLPYFKTAALRQILEQPIAKDELPLTQKIIIDLLRGCSPQTAGSLFKGVTENEEPLPFLGDLMFWHILIQMKERGMVNFVNEVDRWQDTKISL